MGVNKKKIAADAKNHKIYKKLLEYSILPLC